MSSSPQQFGAFPPGAVHAFAILSTASSETHPDGLLTVNRGGILSNYTKVGTGHYTFKLNYASGVATQDNTGVVVCAESDSGGSEDMRVASYLIEEVTDQPSLLHVFVDDVAGSPRDPQNVTITVWA